MYISRLVLVLAIAVLYNRPAEADSGYITGTFKFWNDSVNYCDASAGMNCTGATFPAGASNSYQPIREAKIEIQVKYPNQAWVRIGHGYTDANGNYTILWSLTNGTPTNNWRIRWVHEHRDSVFRVVDSALVTYDSIYPGAGQSLPPLQNGNTVNLFTRNITPLQSGNIYDQAWRAWNFPLKNSTLVYANFGYAMLVWPDPNVTGGAQADGPNNRINIATNDWRPSLQQAHELGHLAAYKANPYKQTAMYNYCDPPGTCPCPSGGCDDPSGVSWEFESSEHRASAFEEGFAEFIAMGAHYWFDATGPKTCNSNIGNCVTVNDSPTPCRQGVARLAEASAWASATRRESGIG